MTYLLQTFTNTIILDINDAINLIEKIDSFYNNAWNKLIIVVSIAITIVGVVVPFFVQWYQKRVMRQNEIALKKEMELQILKIKAEIEADIIKKMEEKNKENESKLKRIHASLNAKFFHLQANNNIQKNDFKGAIGDLIIAATDYLFCKDNQNLRRVLNIITTGCLPKLSRQEVDEIKISTGNDLDLLITLLEKNDKEKIYTDNIREIKVKLNNLPKTKQP
jgi:hypothetical protein